jgi:hypothetical protein
MNGPDDAGAWQSRECVVSCGKYTGTDWPLHSYNRAMSPRLRQLLTCSTAVLLSVLVSASCSSQSFELLPADQGPGSYTGTLSGDASGNFTLRVRDSGQLSGSGALGTFEIELRGVLEPGGRVVAFITERASQRSGEFDGQRNGGQLSGTWRLDPTGSQVVQGDWAATLNP